MQRQGKHREFHVKLSVATLVNINTDFGTMQIPPEIANQNLHFGVWMRGCCPLQTPLNPIWWGTQKMGHFCIVSPFIHTSETSV